MPCIARYAVRQASERAWFHRTLAQLAAAILAFTVFSLIALPFGAMPSAEAVSTPPPSELLQFRTQSSRTLDNHDGTYTTSLYSGPIHYRNAQGAWSPISSALVATDAQGYTWQNEANRFRALFKQQLGDGFLALEAGGDRYRLSVDDAASVTAQARQRGLTYPGAFPGVNLLYDLQPDGVKETLTLANAQAPAAYRFRLTPPDGSHVHAVRGDDGSWSFYAARHARPVFVLQAPWAAEADELVPAVSHASLEVTRAGQDFLLDLSVDATWLHNPLRRFPVRVDPSITVQPAFQDASFNVNCPVCPGVGGERLSIGTTGIGLSAETWRSALQFSLSDIPAGASVSSAKLKLYFDGSCLAAPGGACGGTSHALDAHRMTSSWSVKSMASELRWNASTLGTFTLPAGASAQWMNWDITGTVQSWVNGSLSNFGLLVKRATEPANASGPTPPSRNYAPEPTLGPKLEVTYNGDGGELLEPETVHADGAELHWIPYAGPSAPSFDRYEVHRSPSADFTPSESTRLTTITDSGITSYRDTTARAGGTFTYKVVVSGSETNSRTVTMPPDGQGRKVIRPDPTTGQDTYITYRTDLVECTNRGASDRVKVGTDVNSIFRGLLRFDLSDLPNDTSVTDATLSLWHPNVSSAGFTLKMHRVTGTWNAGGGTDTCTADGATWYESDKGVSWLQDGTAFDPIASASVDVPLGQAAGWNMFGITSLVQAWATGTNPNQGVVIKAQDETIAAGKYIDYYSSNLVVAPTLRPKLSVTYLDGSHDFAPLVGIKAPRSGEQVSGSGVTVSADVLDDRRVETVQFFVDGASIGTDSSSPFSTVWNSTAVANGSHTITAQATDDAGNTKTSTGVGITVGNSASPTSSISSPANNATVTGTVAINASATDDVGVSKVIFTVDGIRVGEDATAPYSIPWDTLSPSLPAYDGVHVLKAMAYDGDGHVTTSAAVTVTAANAAGTKFKADISGSAMPPRVDYDSSAQNQQSYPLSVTVTNRSMLIWAAGDVVLRYRWVRSDGSAIDNAQTFSLGPGPLLPDGSTSPININVLPPAPSVGAARETYKLRIDLFDQSSSSWFAGQGNRPFEERVPVGERNQEPALGIESFYSYDSENLGAGIEHLVNVATGNSIVRWTPLQAPGEGISTTVSLTYNSREGACNFQYCPAGEGWSLGISGLTRLGRHQFDPHGNDRVLVDSDGTMYRFTWNNQLNQWTAPGGVHLYLRSVSNVPGEMDAAWAVTRPDRATYYYDAHGNPLSVVDGNLNKLRFVLDDEPGESSHSHKRVRQVVDQGGREFHLDYYDDEGAAPDDQSNHRLHFITDHLGHTLEFIYDHGRLIKVVESGGEGALGGLPDRSLQFGYEATGSRLLESVTDPLGHVTTFTYSGTGNERKIASRLDRTRSAQALTSFSYGSNSTTVTAPLNRVTIYHYLSTDRDRFSVDSIQDPAGETRTIAWTDDEQVPPQPERHPHVVTEAGGSYTQYLYNLNGLVEEESVLTDRRGPGPNDDIVSTTRFDYEDSMVEGDTSGPLAISDLSKRTDPKGVATPTIPDDYQWQYVYYERTDGRPNGNLMQIIDPTGATTNYTYYQSGRWRLEKEIDANNHETTYSVYDANGFPTQITDSLGHVTVLAYNDDGLLLSSEDALHHGYSGDQREYRTVNDYDSFHRLVRQSSPKSTKLERGRLIWSQTTFDANDNVIAERQPSYRPDDGASTTIEYDAMDRQSRINEPVPNKITTFDYDPAGRLTRTTLPKGILSAGVQNDYVIENSYDALDRVTIETLYDAAGAPTNRTYYCYAAGKDDLLWVTAPNAMLQQLPDCNGTPPLDIPDYTMRFAYDDAHQLIAETDPLGQTATTEYDLNGNVVTEINEEDTREDRVFNQRNELVRREETFRKDEHEIPTRVLTTQIEYDLVGNVKREISPRAWDAAGGAPPFTDYVTDYVYDELDRAVRIDLPTAGAQQRTYIHRGFDAVGNLTSLSLPVEVTTPEAVPDNLRTNLDHYDTGAIAESNDHVLTPTNYDYTAEGWQSSRSADNPRGRKMSWQYYPDGQLARAYDRQGNFATYAYDLNGNLTATVDGRGQGRRPLRFEVESTYDGFDQPTKAKIREVGSPNWTYTSFGYDLNGNVTSREDNGVETTSGQHVSDGRLHSLVYDFADEPMSDTDLGVDQTLSDGDNQAVFAYFPTGLPQSETLSRRQDGAWQGRQRSEWAYFANGDMASETTRRGGPADQIVEQHALGYEEQLPSGRVAYVNGNRTTDSFILHGPPGSATACETSCTTDYKYGVRENLVQEKRTRNGQEHSTDYDLDPTMNVRNEKLDGAIQREYDYTGTRLDEVYDYTGETPPAQVYRYDTDGNVECVVAPTWTGSVCPAAPGQGGAVDARLLVDFDWDYQNRPTRYRRYESGTLRDDAVYDFDPFDRLYEESESHQSAPTRVTDLTYFGASNLVSQEVSGSTTKSYTYDVGGRPRTLALTQGSPPETTQYAYSANAHADVSLLTTLSQEPAQVFGSYGYQPYGREDVGLTQGDQAGASQVNPYRFSRKRFDSGASNLDMGARRYDDVIGRFIQRDVLSDANSDLGLSQSMTAQNRFVLAAGNPVSFLEVDGHDVAPVDGTREVEDFHGRRPRYRFFRIPFQPSRGLVWGGHFIAAKTVGGSIGGAGNGRGFSAYADGSRYKGAYRLNFRRGRGWIRVNPTCSSDHKTCWGPNPIRDFAHCQARVFGRCIIKDPSLPSSLPFRRSNRVGIWTHGNTLTLKVALTHAKPREGNLFSPAIDSRMELAPSGSSQFRLKLEQDHFPSFELYQKVGSQVRTICRNKEIPLPAGLGVATLALKANLRRQGCGWNW